MEDASKAAKPVKAKAAKLPEKTRRRANDRKQVTPRAQCVAKSKQSGQRCKRAPIPGGTVCVMHGGKSPAVAASARARLAAEVLPSLTTLATIRDKKSADDADRIRASVALLDRAGFGPRVTMEIEESRNLLLERLRELRREAGLAELDPPAADDDVIDAEVVDDAT